MSPRRAGKIGSVDRSRGYSPQDFYDGCANAPQELRSKVVQAAVALTRIEQLEEELQAELGAGS